MISILHILQQIPIIRNFLRHDKYISSIENKINDNNKIDNFIIYQFSKIIKLSLESNNIRIRPNSLKELLGKKNSRWSEIEHQDSQEFYIYFITKIEEECGQEILHIPLLNIKNESNDINTNILRLLALKYIHNSERKDYSQIKKMFIGYLISNTQCFYCQTNSPCFESFITLSVSIPINNNNNNNNIYGLEECLDIMIKDEQLDKYNKLNCDICGLKNQSIKKVQIWKSPQILVIQLKRFIIDMYGNQTSKINNPVAYPVNDFDISEYFHPSSPYKEKTIYNLVGINIHRGSLNGGHYVSIIKNNHNKKWYLFDDDKDPEEMEENEIQNRNAYLLFYYRSN